MANEQNLSEEFAEQITQIKTIFDQKLTVYIKTFTNLTVEELAELNKLIKTLRQVEKNFIAAQCKAFEDAQNAEQKREIISDLVLVRGLLENTTPEKIDECRKKAEQGAHRHRTAFMQFMDAALLLIVAAVLVAAIACIVVMLPLIPPLLLVPFVVGFAVLATTLFVVASAVSFWQNQLSRPSVSMNRLIDAVEEATVEQQAKKGNTRLGLFQPQKITADNDKSFSDSEEKGIDVVTSNQ